MRTGRSPLSPTSAQFGWCASPNGIGLADGEILAGELPRKQLRLVQAWIELHRDELMADWELAASGEQPYKIAPL